MSFLCYNLWVMTIIKDILGVEHNINCIACSIQDGQITLPVERISETNYFVAEQDLEYPIEGFVILVSKRHIKSILEFSSSLKQDLISHNNLSLVCLLASLWSEQKNLKISSSLK